MENISKIQQIQFDLMRLSSFNNFDGNQVVDDLIKHRNLWRGVILDRDDLIKLRDIEDDYWNVDTLYILTSGENDVKLQELAEDWGADETEYLTQQEAQHKLGTSHPRGRVLSIWWD